MENSLQYGLIPFLTITFNKTNHERNRPNSTTTSLDLDAEQPPSFDTFVVGLNAELAQVLCISEKTASQYGERSVTFGTKVALANTFYYMPWRSIRRYISADREQFWYSQRLISICLTIVNSCPCCSN